MPNRKRNHTVPRYGHRYKRVPAETKSPRRCPGPVKRPMMMLPWYLPVRAPRHPGHQVRATLRRRGIQRIARLPIVTSCRPRWRQKALRKLQRPAHSCWEFWYDSAPQSANHYDLPWPSPHTPPGCPPNGTTPRRRPFTKKKYAPLQFGPNGMCQSSSGLF